MQRPEDSWRSMGNKLPIPPTSLSTVALEIENLEEESIDI
jgi:hypothetical protein